MLKEMFEGRKMILAEKPLLFFPNLNSIFTLSTEASSKAELAQTQDG